MQPDNELFVTNDVYLQKQVTDLKYPIHNMCKMQRNARMLNWRVEHSLSLYKMKTIAHVVWQCIEEPSWHIVAIWSWWTEQQAMWDDSCTS